MSLKAGETGDRLVGPSVFRPDPRRSVGFPGFEVPRLILVTAIPFGIYDLVEAIDNVESASVPGDEFPTTAC